MIIAFTILLAVAIAWSALAIEKILKALERISHNIAGLSVAIRRDNEALTMRMRALEDVLSFKNRRLDDEERALKPSYWEGLASQALPQNDGDDAP